MELPPLRPTAIQAPSRLANPSGGAFTEGRVFAAEVLQASDGGSIVLGVGRERVAATTQAALQVGQRLWLKVRGSGMAKTLEVLGQVAPEVVLGALVAEPADPRTHPFGLLAQGKGAGELLADLAQALSGRGAASSAQGSELAKALPGFAFTPGADGEELARQLGRSGLTHEARSLARGLEAVPQHLLKAVAEEMVAEAFKALGAKADTGAVRVQVAEELARLLKSPPPAPAAGTSPAAHDPMRLPRTLLGPALQQSLPAGTTAAARAEIVQTLQLAQLSPRLASAVLEALLGEQAASVRAQIATPARVELAVPQDLKQWLLGAMEHLEPGPEQAAARAAHDALEAEQLVALARASVGDGASWMLALREGAGFADARLLHWRAEEREAADPGDSEGGRRLERAVLGLEFSRTGPVRAELAIDADSLHVRLAVSREDVAARLNATLGELRARLESSGRTVHVHVAVRPAESLRVPGAEADGHLGDGKCAVDRLG